MERAQQKFLVNSVQLRPGVVDFIGKLQEKGIPTALATVNEPELLALLELVTSIHSV